MKIRKSKSLNAERNGGPAEQAGVISTNLFLGEKIKFCSDLSVMPTQNASSQGFKFCARTTHIMTCLLRETVILGTYNGWTLLRISSLIT